MSLELLRYLTYAWASLLVAGILCLAIGLVMHLFLPKRMAQRYFREPYFSPTEIAIYSAFPFNYFKIFIFMRLAGWPHSGMKRGLTEAYEMAPVWFRRFSRAFIRVYLIVFVLLMILMLLLAIAFQFVG